MSREHPGCSINHEYYRGVFNRDRALLLDASVPGVTVLDRGAAVFTAGGLCLRVLGATLWTPFTAVGDPVVGMMVARTRINDHRLILTDGGARVFAPEDAAREHALSLEWLLAALRTPHDGPTLVFTHHVPSLAARNPLYPLDAVSAAFYVDLDAACERAAEAGCAGWIYGHHHWNNRPAPVVGGLPLLTAQLGYPGERTDWTGPGVLDLGNPP